MSRQASVVFTFAGLSVLILGNLSILGGDLEASGPNGKECRDAIEVTQEADNDGVCLFFGYCDMTAKAGDCGDSTLTGDTPCSASGGESAWRDAYCGDGDPEDDCDENTDLGNAVKDVHNWSGFCGILIISGPDGNGNYDCDCGCVAVPGAPTGDTVQVKVCTG